MKICYFLFLMNLIVIFSNNENKNITNIIKFSKKYLRKLNENNILIIGFSDYKERINPNSFNILLWDKQNNSINEKSKLNFEVNIFYNDNNREYQDVICSLLGENKTFNIYKFHCEVNITNFNISRVEFFYKYYIYLDSIRANFSLSSLANFTSDNIKSQSSDNLSTDLLIMKNAEIIKKPDNSFQIKADNGELDNDIRILVSKDGNKTELPCKGEKKEIDENNNEYFYMHCTYNDSINKIDFNNIYGYYPNKNKSFVIDFFKSNSTIKEESFEEYYRKKSSGLSTGAIIAIMIPSLIVLLLIFGLALFFTPKRSPTPSLKDMDKNNSTIVVNSSSDVVAQK